MFLDEGRVWIGRAKGRKSRDTYLHPVAVSALKRWLEVRGVKPGPLFVPLSCTGRPMLEHGGMSTSRIWRIVQERAAEAGYAAITPHDLRRFLISNLLTHTDLVLVARIAGHSRTSTTAAYDRRPGILAREAVEGHALPRIGTVVR